MSASICSCLFFSYFHGQKNDCGGHQYGIPSVRIQTKVLAYSPRVGVHRRAQFANPSC